MSMLASKPSGVQGGGALISNNASLASKKTLVEISTAKNVIQVSSSKHQEALSHAKARDSKAPKKLAEDEDVDDEEEEDDNTTATEEVNGFKKGAGAHQMIGKNELSKVNGHEDYGNGKYAAMNDENESKDSLLNKNNSVRKGSSTAMLALAMPLPLVAAGHSLAPDMVDGWKP